MFRKSTLIAQNRRRQPGQIADLCLHWLGIGSFEQDAILLVLSIPSGSNCAGRLNMQMNEVGTEPFEEKGVILRKAQAVYDHKLMVCDALKHLLTKPALTFVPVDLQTNRLASCAIEHSTTRADLIIDHQAEPRIRKSKLFEKTGGRGFACANPAANSNDHSG